MRKSGIAIMLAWLLPTVLNGQCTTSNLNAGNSSATTCVCPAGGGSNCDLLPDITIAQLPLGQSSNYTEYPQVCNPPCNGNDGRLRVGVSTPIIGYGPLESRGTAWYVCGTDTLNAGSVANIPSTCPVTGQPPKQLINQRIYHKNNNEMTYWERPAGSMTYHPSHGHQHVDDWGIYTLRINNGNPNPLNWPIVGTGSKLGYCLLDLGNCTSSNGYCTDSLGTTLNNTNIPNYGLGGGSYGCSNTVQGISNGYIDTYSQNLDGMWINIPPGVCNGTYWIVAQVDPYNYFLETNENNNVAAAPITLAQQSASSVATVSASAAMPICASDNVTLTASLGDTYMWSNGATTQSIQVSGAGTYMVTVTNTCGMTTSSPFVVTTTGPNPPATTNDSVCGSGSMTLIAGGSGTISWYNAATGGSPLATGNSYVTPVLSTTKTYYAEDATTTGGQSLYCPPVANTIGSGGNYTGNQYLQFDVLNPCTLASVKIYADVAGSFTVQMLNSGGSQLFSTNVSVPAGESRITLNYPLTQGTGFRLTRAGSFSLYRNNGGVSYPYNVANYVSITGSSAGSAFYYFFYDWEVVNPVQTCHSSRTAALAIVHTLPSVTFSGLGSVYNLLDPPANLVGTPPGGTFSGPGVSGNTFNPSAAGTGGPYNITYSYTDANGCSNSAVHQTTVICPVPDKPTTFSGATEVCINSMGKPYSVAPSAGASTYAWTPPTGATIVSGNGTNQVEIDYSASFVTSDLCVTADNVCGSSMPKCVEIQSINIPSKPLSMTGQKWSVCNSTHTYTVPPKASADHYSWTMGAGASITGGAGTNSVQIQFGPAFESGQICVTADNKCGSSIPRCRYVSPFTKPINEVFGPSSICEFQTGVAFSVNPVSGATSYDWKEPNSVTLVSGQGTTSAVYDWGDQTKVLYVSALNACGASKAKKKVVKVTCRVFDGNNPTDRSSLTIYPNPASDHVRGELDTYGESEKEGLVFIVDVLGNEIARQHISLADGMQTCRFDLKGISPGVYFMVFRSDRNRLMRKFVIQ